MRSLLSACASDVGLVREHNEDSCLVWKSCMAVADGLGGHNAGEVASKIAIDIVAASAELLVSGEKGLGECMREANARVLEAADGDAAFTGMGTTLTVAVAAGGSLRIAHVGDSRAYLISNGTITRLTHDHSVVGEMVRSGALTPDQAHTHPGRHAITRALGFFDELEVDEDTYAFGSGDAVLLCTDGLHDVVSDDEILQAVVTRQVPEEICRLLVEMARARGGPDNITVAVGIEDE